MSIATIYEAKHSSIETDENGQHWVVRDEQTETEFGDRIICEAFTRSEDETHEDMLNAGYMFYGNGFYVK